MKKTIFNSTMAQLLKQDLLRKSAITINAKTSESTSSIQDIANHVKSLISCSINSEKEKDIYEKA